MDIRVNVDIRAGCVHDTPPTHASMAGGTQQSSAERLPSAAGASRGSGDARAEHGDIVGSRYRRQPWPDAVARAR